VFGVTYCSPTFDENSDEQIDARWPGPNNTNETYATQTCRAIILDTAVIGQSCLDSIGNETSAADIVQACISDVQVFIASN